MNNTVILPGILEQEWSNIEKKVELVRPFTKALHVDIIDGIFAPNTTFLDPEPFKKYAQDFVLELHMMVDNPIEYVKPFGVAGFARFVGHVERMPDQQAFLQEARQFGEACLAIDGPTPVSSLIAPYEQMDGILVMTIKAGFSGQSFMSEHLEKVAEIRKQTNIPIEVDGGVNKETIVQAKEAGATRFAVTSGIFKESNPEEAYNTLCSLIA